jgi:hypothetical protein
VSLLQFAGRVENGGHEEEGLEGSKRKNAPRPRFTPGFVAILEFLVRPLT